MRKGIVLLLFLLVLTSILFSENESRTNEKVELKPYSWISNKPIKRISNPENQPGTWEYASKKIKEIKEGVSKKDVDDKEVGDKPVLLIEVFYINANNMKQESVMLASKYVSSEKLYKRKGYLEFDYYPKGQYHSEEFYDKNGELKHDSIQGLVYVCEGDSPFADHFQKERLPILISIT